MECGGFDGETASNTLSLELEFGWTGLVIEPNPYYYAQLHARNRNIWSLNSCLSAERWSTRLGIPVRCADHLPFEDCRQAAQMSQQSDSDVIQVPCFTFTSIMRALNITTIDYFSLDVEGMELPVLQTIPFESHVIKVLSIEYKHSRGGKEPIVHLMRSKGYSVFKNITHSEPKRSLYVDDLMFIRNDVLHEIHGPTTSNKN